MSDEFLKLINIVKELRDPETGCPWDIKQTHESLIKYLKEESEELIEAIQNNDFKNIEEELGDVLLQVILHSQIGSETKKFDIISVIKKLNEKLIRRHPHVFGDEKATSIEDVKRIWKEAKQNEKKIKN